MIQDSIPLLLCQQCVQQVGHVAACGAAPLLTLVFPLRTSNEVCLKLRKILLIVIGAIVLYAAYIAISLMFLPPVTELADRKMNMTIQVKDWKGNYHPFVVGPKSRYWTPTGSIPA